MPVQFSPHWWSWSWKLWRWWRWWRWWKLWWWWWWPCSFQLLQHQVHVAAPVIDNDHEETDQQWYWFFETRKLWGIKRFHFLWLCVETKWWCLLIINTIYGSAKINLKSTHLYSCQKLLFSFSHLNLGFSLSVAYYVFILIIVLISGKWWTPVVVSFLEIKGFKAWVWLVHCCTLSLCW